MAVIAEIDWGQGVEDAWSNLVEFVPEFLAFLVVLIIGYFIAKALAKAADVVLERVGFDRAVERGGVGRAIESSKYDASDVVSKVIYYLLMLIVLLVAFGVFGDNPISDLLEGVIAYIPRVLVAIAIIVIAAAIAAAAKELIQASLGGLSYGPTLATAASIAIVTVGVFAALDQLQIAPDIVNGLFYALLAIIAGSAIIAIGGGGIRPMQQRWETALNKYDEEKPRMRSAYSTRRRDSAVSSSDTTTTLPPTTTGSRSGSDVTPPPPVV